MSVHLVCVYGDAECARFKKVDDLALDVIGEAIRRAPTRTFIARYESLIKAMSAGSSMKKRSTAPAPTSQAK